LGSMIDKNGGVEDVNTRTGKPKTHLIWWVQYGNLGTFKKKLKLEFSTLLL
jgi:hypothetical protein